MEASQMNGESSNLLQTQTHILNHLFNFMDTQSLKCALQLGIPDIIHSHGQPMTLSNLVAALHIQPCKAQFLRRLMRVLVHSGFFTETDTHTDEDKKEVEYTLTPSSHLLLPNEPLRATPFLFLVLDHVIMTPWDHLSSWLLGTDHVTAFEMANGRGIWDNIAGEERFKNLFHEGMLCDSELMAKVVVRECGRVFEGLKTVIDVGGGTGTMAKAIAEKFPTINCIVYDLPHVVDNLQGTKNLCFVGGDMFKDIPKADAVLLKWILHDWDDEECIKILKNCREAIPSKEMGGKLIIIDIIIGNNKADKESTKLQLSFDMLMMLNTTGKERDLMEWEKLFQAAGFDSFKIMYEVGARSLIEVYP